MMENILDAPDLDKPKPRRRELLPTWVLIFACLFFVLSIFTFFILIMGLLGGKISLSLYGIYTTQAFSISGIIISTLFILKGIVSFGLWTEKEWAVKLAILDSVIGIVTCLIMTIYMPIFSNNYHFSIRLELIALFPYFFTMNKIQANWITRS